MSDSMVCLAELRSKLYPERQGVQLESGEDCRPDMDEVFVVEFIIDRIELRTGSWFEKAGSWGLVARTWERGFGTSQTSWVGFITFNPPRFASKTA